MYMVGSPHPNRERALALTTHLARQDERMITSVEVYQEILHRYTAIHRPEAIDVAFEALDSIVDSGDGGRDDGHPCGKSPYSDRRRSLRA